MTSKAETFTKRLKWKFINLPLSVLEYNPSWCLLWQLALWDINNDMSASRLPCLYYMPKVLPFYLIRECSTQWDKKNPFSTYCISKMENLWCTEKYDPFATQPYTINPIKHQVMYFNRKKKINLNKKCELPHCVPHTVHSETVLFFPINNNIFRIIVYLFNQNK